MSKLLKSAIDLAELLPLVDKKASEIERGDVIIHQGNVVLVDNVETSKYGDITWLMFHSEVASYDGYLIEVMARPDDIVKRIPRGLLDS